jgi:hypothetical protein
MRTIDFETILAQGLQYAGLDRDNVTEQSFNQIRDFANFRLRRAWEYDTWPDLNRVTAFPVVHNDNLHYAIIPNDGVVTNSQGTFKVNVGDILQITKEDPRLMGKHTVVGYSIDEYEQVVSGVVNDTVRRIILDNPNTDEVYVSYRLACPELVGSLYTQGPIYKPGQIVYWAYSNNHYFAPTTGNSYAGKKGNFWKCIVETTTKPNIDDNNSPTANDKWEKVKIPQFFGQYIIKGIHADWLKSEMQIQLGQAIEMEAQSLLDFEVQKVIVQQGLSPRLNFNQIY